VTDIPISAAPALPGRVRLTRPLAVRPHPRAALASLATVPGQLLQGAHLIAAAETVHDAARLARHVSRSLDHQILGLPAPAPTMVMLRGDIITTTSLAADHVDGYREVFRDRRWGHVAGFRARPGQTVVDAGVGSGFYALWQAKAVGSLGRVVTFAAHPHHAELAENVAHNAMDWIDVRTGVLGPEGTTLDQLVTTEVLGAIDVLRLPSATAYRTLTAESEQALPRIQRVVIDSPDTETHDLLVGLGFAHRRNDSAAGVAYYARS
jgi:hypothetical protein